LTNSRIILVCLAIVTVGLTVWGVQQFYRNPTADLLSSHRSTDGVTPLSTLNAALRPPGPAVDYVGSAVCAECHASHSERYQTHPMAHSAYHVSDVDPIENFGPEFGCDAPQMPGSDRVLRYYVTRDEQLQYHHEIVSNGAGDVLQTQDVPVEYEIGSGRLGRSYLINREGVLYMSPLSWYSGKQVWDLSPGFDRENVRFERRILDGCLTCHIGRVAAVEDQPNRFHNKPFIETSIGCERCHGPGQKHVELRRAGTEDVREDPIVNPARLDPWRRDSVCFQCHFKGKERFARYGRTEFDFRPGDDVRDIWTIFVAGTGVEAQELSTESVSQVEQMLSSACYQKSEGRLGCISCHDPHFSPGEDQKSQFYRSRCLQCHSAGDPECSLPETKRRETSADDSCIDCHMPRLATNDIPHTSQTDHRVKATYGQQAPTTPVKEVLVAIDDKSGRLPEPELERARGILMVKEASSDPKSKRLSLDAIPRLEAWLKLAPDDVEAAYHLGAAYSLNRQLDQAMATWKHALEVRPKDESLLRGLMINSHDQSRWDDGVMYGRRLIDVNPWDPDYHGRMAHMLGQLGDFQNGIEYAQRSLELNPDQGVVHGWLAAAYALTGDREQAMRHRRRFDELSGPGASKN